MHRAAFTLALLAFAWPGHAQTQSLPNPDGGGAAALSAPPREPAARRAWLKSRLDEVLAEPVLRRTRASVAIMDPDSGKLVYAHNEKLGLNAASNVKLVTEAASLSLLGPEFRWKTTVLGPAPADGGKAVSAGELRGDLYVKTSGDPALSTSDLNALASSLSAVGLRRVRGGMIIDTSAFDSTTSPPVFDQKDESAAFRAPSSSASLNGNAVTVTITPGPTPGARARVVLDPPSPALVLSGRVTTAARGPAAPAVETSDAGKGRTRVTVRGRILVGSEPRTVERRVVSPEHYFGQSFKQILGKRGISIDGAVRVGIAPKDGLRVLTTHYSPALAVVIQDLGKRSINFAAEQTLRTLGGETQGAPGTFGKGLEAVARYLEGIGIPRGSYVMKNGSGLYDSNRFSAVQIAMVLRAAMRDFRISSEFLASLAVGGADGTLAHRMAGSAAERLVRAKTGTLANASCLSGIVGAPGSKPLVFSILMNDQPSAAVARAAQDRMTATLVEYLDTSLAK
jgi:D-alanyl-D-alanine carboxypeptidase/D-alanyl-D-alanine-endopeptidase (penicillin-binding protein 4)